MSNEFFIFCRLLYAFVYYCIICILKINLYYTIIVNVISDRWYYNMEAKKDDRILLDDGILNVCNFLISEGLSLGETIQLVNKMEEIYQEIRLLNSTYSISEISLIVSELLDDNFFDERFIESLLEEAVDSNVKWASL